MNFSVGDVVQYTEVLVLHRRHAVYTFYIKCGVVIGVTYNYRHQLLVVTMTEDGQIKTFYEFELTKI